MKADLLSNDAFLEHVYNKERNIIMAAIDNKKIVEAVLYILNVTKGLDYYHVFKVLYFAEREHLKLWGTKILEDDFVAMEYGPVPTKLYNAVKNNAHTKELSSLFAESVSFAQPDAGHVLLPKRQADLDYLSASDIECLDKSITENAYLSFNRLVSKSHDAAWRAAGLLGVINPVVMASEAGADEDMQKYVGEQIQLGETLMQ